MLLAGDTLVITELMAINGRTLADEDGEFEDWIEIYNPTADAVDLDGWFLTDDPDRLDRWRLPALTMEPGGYELVFASNKDRLGDELHTDFKLAGSGEFLALVEPDGTTIASEYRPEFPEQTSDTSYGLATDLETEGYFLLPTPGAPNVGEPIADPTRQIVISEIMYHPASEDSREEFIELLNLGTEAVDLTGWKIDKGVQFEFPAISLAAGERLVVAANLFSFQAAYGNITNVIGGWTGQLSNQSEAIAIEDASGKRIDRVEYADGGDWAVRERDPAFSRGWVWSDAHDGGGRSLELINPLMSNKYGQNWQASLDDGGTPGEANSVAADNTAPLILDVIHSPAIPRARDTVTVSARILDDSTASPTVNVYYRRDGGNFSALVMRDNGLSGDDVAGDGTYAAELPAQADGTIVEFYVEASDNPRDGASSRTWPAPAEPNNQQIVNALYQVEDQVNRSDLPVYRTIMTSSERNFFVSQTSDAQMNATFISSIGGQIEVRYNAGLRVRGSTSRNRNPPPNRINLPSDNSWNGVTALNLNSVAPQNQVAGAVLFALVGLPAAHAMPVQYLTNGTNLTGGGFYAYVEPLNSEFADNHYPDDGGGNLYKGRRPNESPPGGRGAGLRYFADDPAAYFSYLKLTNGADADWSDVIDLTFQLNNSSDASYIEDISQVIDIDQWLRFFAFNALIGNNEGGLITGDQMGDDYAMYRGIEDPRFQLVPHDLDTLFQGVNNSIFRATNVAALERFLTHPDILPRYYAQFVDLIEDVTTPEIIEPVLREALGNAVSQNTINGMLNYLRNRGNNILARFPHALTAESSLPTVAGRQRSTSSSYTLQGEFDAAATRSVFVNGFGATLNPLTGTWSFNSNMAINQQVVVPSGATWRYLDDGSDLAIEWRDASFDDSAWNLGEAQLGFGDNDEATVINGGPSDDRNITTFFRYEFQIDDPTQITSLTARLLRDDGAIIYLNGRDVGRSNIRDTRVKNNTLALSNVSGGEESTWFSLDIDVSSLVAGRNVLAVEVHQGSSTSSDLSFDLSLVATIPVENDAGRLAPGINRIVVEAFDGSDGTGSLLSSEKLDIWYDDGSVAPLTGPITADRTLLAQDGPWYVTEDVIVEEGATLTIEPGTTVYFDEATRLVVRGTLIAEGLPMRRIRFTGLPGAAAVPNRPGGRGGLPDGPPRWGGIQFRDTMSDQNLIAHADFDYAQNSTGSIGARNSQIVVDDVTFFGTHLRMVYADASSVIIRNSVFANMFADGESPAELGLDNISEQIKSIGRIPDGGQFIIQNNLFGTNKGHNDVIDVTSRRRPNPIVQILDNVFLGSGDEEIDLGGDVYIAGNRFLNIYKDDANSDRGYANAISTGDAGRNATTVVARNVFWEVDHALNLKNETSTIFENNTVVRVHDDFEDRFGNENVGSAINYFVPEPNAVAGTGGYISGNIFWSLPRVLGNVDLPDDVVTILQFDRNFVDPSVVNAAIGSRDEGLFDLGTGNAAGMPNFVDESTGNVTLGPGSPAIGSGPFGYDFGALVPGGAWIMGEPVAITNRTDATLTVGGPGIFAYRYRVNDGPLSDPIDIGSGFDAGGNTIRTSEIVLTDLPAGSYTVEVFGQDFAGEWQVEPTQSETWQIVSGTLAPQVVISEILASNQSIIHGNSLVGDLIELYNAGDQIVDLSGMSITDNNDRPEKYVFPAGTTLAAGEYLVLHADDNASVGGELHTGFALKSDGDDVALFDSNGEELDYIRFGIQLGDLSVARLPSGEWGLAAPTFGSANVAQPLGDPHGLKINEWFTAGEYTLGERTRSDDFVELYNGDSLPVLLSGLFVTDLLDGAPDKHEIEPLSYIEAVGYAVLIADSKTSSGADHVNMRLASEWGWIGLFDQNVEPIDRVLYGPQQPGVSQGRVPDGGDSYEFFAQPTPGIDGSPPSVPAGVEFSVLTDSRVELRWQTSVDEQSGVAGYYVYRSGELVATTSAPSYADSTVLPGVIYSYRISAFNGDGIESAASSPISTQADTTPPTAPADLVGIASSSSQIQLSWAASIDMETLVREYRIYRDGQLIGLSETTSFDDTSFSVGPTISYEVSAVNEDSFESIRSAPLSFTFLQQGTAGYSGASDSWINANFPDFNYNAPGEQHKLEVDGADPQEVLSLLRWDVSQIPADHSVDGVSLTVNVTNVSGQAYEIYAVNRPWNDDEVTWQQAAAGVNWQDPGARGAADRAQSVLGIIQAPAQGELTLPLTANGVAAVQSWVVNPAANYGILISDDDNTNGVVFDAAEGGQPPLLIISHRAVDGPDVTPPTIPTGLHFEQLTPLLVEVAWDAAVDPESGVSVYNVFRNGSRIGTTAQTTFIDTPLEPGMAYSYQVSAVNTIDLESGRSAAITTDRDATPPSIPIGLQTTSLAPTEIGLAWDESVDQETDVVVYTISRNGVEVGLSPTTTFVDLSVTPGAPVTYTIAAINADGAASSQSQPITVTMMQDGVSPSIDYLGTSDTWIVESDPDSAAGATDTGIDVDGDVGGSGLQEVSLIKWDLDGLFDPGTRVTDATITLTITEQGGDLHQFFAALRPWVEAEATWNDATSGTPWQQPGAGGIDDLGELFADLAPQIAVGSYTVPLSEAGLALVQSWLDNPASNNGLMLIAPQGSSDGFTFASRESADAATRPLLSISTSRLIDDRTPPTTPTDLVAEDNQISEIRLTWAPALDAESGIARYDVYRDSVLLATSSSPQYRDTSVAAGREYTYQIQAINGAGLPSSLSQAVAHTISLGVIDFDVQINAPQRYLPGVPFLVRVDLTGNGGLPKRDVANVVAQLTATGANVSLSTDRVDLYYGTGSILVTVNDTRDFELVARIGGESSSRTLLPASDLAQMSRSGELPLNDVWSGVVHVTGDVTVPVGGTLTIRPGTIVLVGGTSGLLDEDGFDIIVEGSLQALGTETRPITITAAVANAPWGEIRHISAAPSLYRYTNITRAGHSPRGGHTNTGPAIRVQDSDIVFERVSITDLVGKTMQADDSTLEFYDSLFARSVMGPEIDNTALLFDGGHISQMLGIYQENGEPADDNDGIYLNRQDAGQEISILNSVVVLGDDDGIDTLGADVTIDGVIVAGFADKGISIIEGDSTISNTLIVGTDIGISAKVQSGNESRVRIDQVTIDANAIAIQARDKFGNPDALVAFDISNSILLAPDGVQTDYDPADITIDYSIVSEVWNGQGNLTTDPMFVSVALGNYYLQESSPAIDAGDPAAEPDSDGSRTDMGAFPWSSVVLPPQVIGVFVSGSEWTAEFRSQFGGTGYPMATGADQQTPLPWANLDQLTIQFSSDVQIGASDLELRGYDGTDYAANLTGFSYSNARQTATWTLSAPLTANRFEIRLGDSVLDRTNVPLDGEWTPMTDSFPSGDGQAGGDFNFQFAVLPGDINQSGIGDLRDVQALRRALLSDIGDADYPAQADLDGSGNIDIRDLQLLRDSLLTTLPSVANLALLAATERRQTSSEALFARLAADDDAADAAQWSSETIDAVVVDDEDWPF